MIRLVLLPSADVRLRVCWSFKMVKITGAKEFRQKLKNMSSPEVVRKIAAVLYIGGETIEKEAERLITTGSISGKGHVASLPGEPPNADTRELDTNIETRIVSDINPTVHVEALAPHALPLEVGTSKMAARPFMKPAANSKKKEVVEKVAASISKIVRQA